MDYFSLADFKDFIRSPEEIIREIHPTTDDIYNQKNQMIFRIFPLHLPSLHSNDLNKVSVGDIIAYYLHLRDEVESFISNYSKDYLWDYQPPQTRLVLPVEWKNDGNSSTNLLDLLKNDIRNEIYILGILNFYDNVEDEWYLIECLMNQLSIQYPTVCISIQDEDGDILLIEAADYIPEWLSPDNCTNRVWIRDGKVIILSNHPSNPLTLSEAFLFLQSTSYLSTNINSSNNEYDNCDSQKVQSCIQTRLSRVSKNKSVWQHQGLCILPKSITNFIHSNPQIMSHIVNVYCSCDRLTKNRYLSSFAFIHKYLPSLSTAKSNNNNNRNNNKINSDDQPIIMTTINFTKILYAKLNFEPFYVPKALSSYQKYVESCNLQNIYSGKKILTNENDSTEDKEILILPSNKNLSKNISFTSQDLWNAFILGCKIISGLETLYQTLIQNVIKLPITPSSSIRTIPILSNLLEEELENIKKRIDSYDMVFESTENKDVAIENYSKQSIENGMLLAMKSFDIVYPTTVIFDDDSWINMTTEKFDQHMNRISSISSKISQNPSFLSTSTKNKSMESNSDNISISHESNHTQSISSSNNNSNDNTKDKVNFTNVVNKVKDFMNSKSVYDGVENKEYQTPLDNEISMIPHTQSKVSQDTNTVSNMNKQSILDKYMKLLQESVDDDSDSDKDRYINDEIIEESQRFNSTDIVNDNLFIPLLERNINGRSAENKKEVILDGMTGKGLHYISSQSFNSHSDNDDDDDDNDSDDCDSGDSKPFNSIQSKMNQQQNQQEKVDDESISNKIKDENNFDDEISNDIFEDEDFMAGYEAAMDEELLNSTLKESFEYFPVNGENGKGIYTDTTHDIDVDIDANLIKYLLESHMAQGGGVGPASQLLSQLGIKFPMLSHVIDDEDGDEDDGDIENE